MLLNVDTDKLDADTLGQLLMIFLKTTGVNVEASTYILGMGWDIAPPVDHRYLRLLMGDEADRPNAAERVFDLQYKNGLTLTAYFDGDISILFHNKGLDNFAIINKGSSLNRWEAVQL